MTDEKARLEKNARIKNMLSYFGRSAINVVLLSVLICLNDYVVVTMVLL
jgi:hypothetical protein